MEQLYIKDNEIKPRKRIVIEKDGRCILNPSEAMVLADGWEKYEPEQVDTQVDDIPVGESLEDQLTRYWLGQFNARTDITNEEALDLPLMVYGWETYAGKSLAKGQIVSYNDTLYRVRQDIASVLADQFPSVDTAALYEAIEVEAEGTETDTIAYVPPMEIFAGKYYTQNGVTYKCTRDSGTALSHDLSALVGLYVEAVES